MEREPVLQIGDWAVWTKNDPPALVRITRCLPDDREGFAVYGVHLDRVEMADDVAASAKDLRPLAAGETVDDARLQERLGKR